MTEIISPKMAASRNGMPIPSFGAGTNIGLVREQNEDSLIAMPPLFALCDGMGGHEAGEVASGIAVKSLLDEAPIHADGKALGRAVIAANRAVLAGAEQEKGRPGMGTTCTAAIVEGDHLVVAQVGDSRAYLLHEGSLQQITRDHSLVADLVDAGRITEDEARVHPQRSIITRALGNDPDMVPDIYELAVEPGDRLMLCSDGLYGMVVDPVIEKVTKETPDPSECVDELIKAALDAGGADNVSVIVVDISSSDEGKGGGQTADATSGANTKRRRKRIIGFVIAFILVVGGVVGGTYAYAQHSAYLIDQNGYVTVYRGLRGHIGELSFSWYEKTTDIKVSDLSASVASRLASGIQVDSVASADELLTSYRQQVFDSQSSTAGAPSNTTVNANNPIANSSGDAASTEGA